MDAAGALPTRPASIGRPRAKRKLVAAPMKPLNIYGQRRPEASPMTPKVPLPRFNPRSDRRQKQVKHLVACGERCVLEALIAVDNGQPLDLVLRDFERLSPEAYKLTSRVIRGTT
jgi:hypothetical protein